MPPILYAEKGKKSIKQKGATCKFKVMSCLIFKVYLTHDIITAYTICFLYADNLYYVVLALRMMYNGETKEIGRKPKEAIMKVGIICAGDEEFAPFLPLIKDCKVTEKAMLKFYEGKIHGIEVAALFSGVCKVNAAIATQLLIDVFGTDIIINSGTAGGMDGSLEIFDTVISTEAYYHDVAPDILTEFHPWMNSVFFEADRELIKLSKAAVSKIKSVGKVVWGRMATGESFITGEGRQKICDAFAPLTVDMETASIAHVCYVNNIPFLSIRCVTDTAEHSGVGNFEENCIRASNIAKDIAIALLYEIKMIVKQ